MDGRMSFIDADGYDIKRANESNRESVMLDFIVTSLKHPRSVGAVVPSSRYLARVIVAAAELNGRRAIFEFGPGTGAITKYILQRTGPGQRYVGIEQNSEFTAILTRKFPHVTFVNDSVENLQAIAARLGIDSIDVIICGLPWASLPVQVQDDAFKAMRAFLRTDSMFCTYAYPMGLILPGARALRARLHAEFTSVRFSPIVWRNVPPAFVYICRR
jgi:phosphatidylethanolamine/phosphatidyl-N-methylethanolamine N-methyltransferase